MNGNQNGQKILPLREVDRAVMPKSSCFLSIIFICSIKIKNSLTVWYSESCPEALPKLVPVKAKITSALHR